MKKEQKLQAINNAFAQLIEIGVTITTREKVYEGIMKQMNADESTYPTVLFTKRQRERFLSEGSCQFKIWGWNGTILRKFINNGLNASFLNRNDDIIVVNTNFHVITHFNYPMFRESYIVYYDQTQQGKTMLTYIQSIGFTKVMLKTVELNLYNDVFMTENMITYLKSRELTPSGWVGSFEDQIDQFLEWLAEIRFFEEYDYVPCAENYTREQLDAFLIEKEIYEKVINEGFDIEY